MKDTLLQQSILFRPQHRKDLLRYKKIQFDGSSWLEANALLVLKRNVMLDAIVSFEVWYADNFETWEEPFPLFSEHCISRA